MHIEGLPRISVNAMPSDCGRALVWVYGPVAQREDGAGGYQFRILPVAEMVEWGRIWFDSKEARDERVGRRREVGRQGQRHDASGEGRRLDSGEVGGG